MVIVLKTIHLYTTLYRLVITKNIKGVKMIDYMQTSIIISYKDKVDNRIFDSAKALNSYFNQINNINCTKEVWLDEAFISFTFKSERSYKKALEVLYPTY